MRLRSGLFHRAVGRKSHANVAIAAELDHFEDSRIQHRLAAAIEDCHMVGQKYDRGLLFFIPNFDTAKEILFANFGHAEEKDHFITSHVAFFWRIAFFHHSVAGVVFHPSH